MKSENDVDARINQDLTRLMEVERGATRAHISNRKVGKERS